MHLAVCDDNIADRKQMERLLGRESDRRQNTTGVLYVDSFGNRDAILTTPMIYDGLFIDMTEDGSDAVEIAGKLREAGSVLPIVFCCSRIDYRKSPSLPDNCFFLDKPIHPAELAAMCDRLLAIKKSQVKRYEFRSLTETFYLEEKDIMYAWPVDDQTVRIRIYRLSGYFLGIGKASYTCKPDSSLALSFLLTDVQKPVPESHAQESGLHP